MVILSTTELERIRDTISLIPSDCLNVIDVGCGDGRLTNRIERPSDIVGLDINVESLKNVKCKKIHASIDDIPCDDNSYDVVICAEVLEHLPDSLYTKALSELGRIAKKYIIISVPNNQNLGDGLVRCPKCGHKFLPSGHVRNYKYGDVSYLLASRGFRIKGQMPSVQYWDYGLLNKLIRILFRQGKFGDATCPICDYHGNRTNGSNNKERATAWYSWIGYLLPRVRNYVYVITIYEKNNASFKAN